MNEPRHHWDERGAIEAAQRADAAASRILVSIHERELLRTAFLLTDDRREATVLVERTVELAFRELRRLDPDSPFRPWLLQRLARAFLAPEDVDGDESSAGGPPAMLDTEPMRYRVDDERRRLRAALGTLDARERLALLLRDFNGLEIEPIASALSQPPGDVQAEIIAARRRLENRVDLPANTPLGVALTEAALEAPRLQVWPAIEDRVLEIQEEEQRRTRRLTGAVIGGVSLAALAVFGLLVFGAVRGEEPTSGVGVAPTATNDAPITITPTAIIVDSPAQTPRAMEPIYIPDGDVPDALLRTREGSTRAPDRNLLQGLSEDVRISLPPGRPLTISPDGETLILIDEAPAASGADRILIAVELDSGDELWRVQLNEEPVSWGNSSVGAAVVAGQVVVVTPGEGAGDSFMQSQHFSLADGERIDRLFLSTSVSGPLVRMFPQPEQSRISVLIWSPATSALFYWNLRIDRPFSETAVFTGRHIEGFDFARARVTPDGHALYEPNTILRDGEPRTTIRFVSFSSFAVSNVELPFRTQPANGALAMTTSHDGRWLYVVSPLDRQVAVVDLQRRQVERLAPLDAPELTVREPDLDLEISPMLYSGRSAALSLDGRTLYVIGAPHEGDGIAATSIWRIDVATWTVTGHWLRDYPAPINSLFVSADDVLAVHTALAGAGRDSDFRFGHLHLVDTGSGEIVSTPDAGLGSFDLAGSLADLYRDAYGKSPAVAGRMPEIVTESTSLPRTLLEIEPQRVVPGQAVDVAVRFLDPGVVQSVREIVPGLKTVRFDPLSIVTVIFTDGERRHLLTLAEEEYGVYSSTLRIEEPGVWDAVVSVDSPEAGWTVLFEDALQVRRTFQAPDGLSYYLAVTNLAPLEPRAGAPVELATRFISSETGYALPDGLPIEGGLPTELRVVEGSGATGMLFRSGHGGYTGIVTFATPGWQVLRLTWTDADGEERIAETGPIPVKE